MHHPGYRGTGATFDIGHGTRNGAAAGMPPKKEVAMLAMPAPSALGWGRGDRPSRYQPRERKAGLNGTQNGQCQ